MKQFSVVFLILFFITATVHGQANYTHLLRLYEDNDFINILGKGTDKGYTNGTMFDYFFVKQHPSRFFPDRWLPKAGPEAVNTFGYSLTQLMFGPKDISKPLPDKDDWPYSGALYLSHTLYSSNPVKKFSLSTTVVAGAMGPLSLAEETQTWVHKLINYTVPMGWKEQMPNDVLLNVNLLAEKMIWQNDRSIELIAGGGLTAGTMINSAAVQMQLRMGIMQPYFNDYISQFSSAPNSSAHRFQLYLFVKPAFEWVAYNALFDGGVFSGKSAYYAGADNKGNSPAPHKITGMLDAGIVFIKGRTSLSFIQKLSSPLLKGISGYVVGNLSFTYSW